MEDEIVCEWVIEAGVQSEIVDSASNKVFFKTVVHVNFKRVLQRMSV